MIILWLLKKGLAHSLYGSKGKNPLVSTKLDLEKAYDCLSWKVIGDALAALNFPPKFIT